MSKNLKTQNDDLCTNSANQSQNIQTRILFLAKIEREKSLNFYESLLDLRDEIMGDLRESRAILDKNLRKIFNMIAKKEREMLSESYAILAEFLECESTESNEIILPSALPNDILGELQNEMGAVDCKSLNILALGVESHHLKTSDFLIKKARNLGANLNIIDILYRFQALSYNHHIPLLQGEMPKPNANPNRANLKKLSIDSSPNSADLSAIAPQITLQDLLNQHPLFSEIKTALDSFQIFYAQTKNIVERLEKGDLSQDELVAFLQKLRF